MTGVTLRYTCITWAMFMGPWSLSPSSHPGGYHNKCIHITWIGLPGRWQKHTVRCVLLKKIGFVEMFEKTKMLMGVSSPPLGSPKCDNS